MNSVKTPFPFPVRILAALSVCAASIALSPVAAADEVVLQDDQLLATFDSDSGALTRLED